MSFKQRIHNVRVNAHAVWIGARDRRVPLPIRLFGFLVAAYAFSPIDLIPDFIPVIGLLDDALLVPLGVWLFVRMVPADLHREHLAQAERASEKPVSRIGAVLIATLWIAIIIWLVFLFYVGRFY